MIEEKNILEKLFNALKNIGSYLWPKFFKDKLRELENLIAKENFWDDNQKAQGILKEKIFLKKL